jgi:hypothetical protein
MAIGAAEAVVVGVPLGAPDVPERGEGQLAS